MSKLELENYVATDIKRDVPNWLKITKKQTGGFTCPYAGDNKQDGGCGCAQTGGEDIPVENVASVSVSELEKELKDKLNAPIQNGGAKRRHKVSVTEDTLSEKKKSKSKKSRSRKSKKSKQRRSKSKSKSRKSKSKSRKSKSRKSSKQTGGVRRSRGRHAAPEDCSQDNPCLTGGRRKSKSRKSKSRKLKREEGEVVEKKKRKANPGFLAFGKATAHIRAALGYAPKDAMKLASQIKKEIIGDYPNLDSVKIMDKVIEHFDKNKSKYSK